MTDNLPELTPIQPADSGAWPETLSDPSRVLLKYWSSKCHGRGFPNRSEIEPRDITKILPHIFIVENLGGEESDYRFLLVGTYIVGIEGECTGRLLSEMFPDRDRHANLWKQYDDCCSGAIYVRRDNLGWREKKFIDYDVVLLPLYGRDENVEYLIGAAHGTVLPG